MLNRILRSGKYFREFKERVKTRFQQEEIWLIHYAIELR